MNELKEMFRQNLNFQRKIIPNFDKLNMRQRQKLIKDYVLHSISELMELLDSINWKTWSDSAKKFSIVRAKEELIDLQKFNINIALLLGMTAEDFYKEFERKSEVNLQRFVQKELLKLKNKLKLCAIDLDGVIYPYGESFVKFVNDKLDSNFKVGESLSPLVTEIPMKKYLKLKDEYREKYGEIYKNPKPYPKVVELLKKLKKKGYHIIILSARPYKKYPNIYIRTLKWLRKNKVPFDFIYWDENKCEKIIKEFTNLKFIIEDNPIEAEKISAFKIKCYLYNRPYNLNYNNDKVIRINNFLDVLKYEN